PDDDGLRAPGAAAAVDEERRRSQPGHQRDRRRPPGLRRQRYLGGNLARPPRPDRSAGSAWRLGAARNAPHSGVNAVELAELTLGRSWVEGERDGTHFAYTRPSPSRYPWQWYWDSCFAAIVWRRFDPARARRELE